MTTVRNPARVVALVSGSGTLLQALLDDADPREAQVVAAGADREGIAGLERARAAGVPAFVCAPQAFADRSAWDAALAEAVAAYDPDLVVSAGFMRILGPAFLGRFPDRVLNTLTAAQLLDWTRRNH